MANANAIVEKMTAIGLQHGEKAGAAIAVAVFLLCISSAISREGIKTTPEQVKKYAQMSDQNLNRKEEREAIIKKLEEGETKIKPTQFAAAVEEQIKVKLVADNYKPYRSWVTPEPGAGLIRDEPELIAPDELFANPGRGGLLVYALDSEGQRIPAPPEEEEEKPKKKYGNLARRKKKKGRGGMGGGMMGGMGGGMMGGQRKKKRRKSKAEIEREEKEDRERRQKQLSAGFVGGPAPESSNDEAEELDEGGPFKEITKGYRWVAITGILDHGQMLENYRKALKNPTIAHPQYMRLDLQRKVLQPDGTWTEWDDVDSGKNWDILDNVPVQEEEFAPENVRPDMLVDRLPFLTAGIWKKVHIGSLVPKEKQELPPEEKDKGGSGTGGSSMSNMMSRMMSSTKGMGGMPSGGSMMAGAGGSMNSMMSGMMPGMTGGGVGTESLGDFWRSEEKKVMIRALDFTVKPNTTYRYRVRIVVANPNYNRDDVSALVNKEKKTLEGPWSKQTEVVLMPPDVQPYAVAAFDRNPQSDTRVRFQVIRFNPADGWTVPHRFDASVGELVGESYRAEIPNSDGTGTKREVIDFTSCQIVLDIKGSGNLNLPSGVVGPSIEKPVYCALLRHDGAMIVHNQADDIGNEFRADTEDIYNYEIEESNKKEKREHSSSKGGMPGSMPGGGLGGSRGY